MPNPQPAQSGTSSTTIYFEDGEQVYPCRCGETHRGDYAVYDHGHHNCMHDRTLYALDALDEVFGGDVMCGACGAVWNVRNL